MLERDGLTVRSADLSVRIDLNDRSHSIGVRPPPLWCRGDSPTRVRYRRDEYAPRDIAYR